MTTAVAQVTEVAADVTIGDLRLGQHAEALVDVVPASLVRGAGGAYPGDQVSVVEARTVGRCSRSGRGRSG
jgi:hypothetical protein